ncbi:hypothetical protein [Winogradskyella helgolandensis]|uniref:hypothetical protein n=1 Tax=Winogradskyella helgolandensis TaxID=2697010 RepID=UPI0015CC2D92|nr:hypothetical protein [Winogradskyella helgolandensis]
MSSKESKKDFQTDWAFEDDFTTHVHISNAESGLNGYYCLGCKKEMQAVKGQIREHYFRHHAKDVDKNNTECVVANRKYRELIARDILQRLKQLKLPAVYKYPPNKSDGLPSLLESAKIIEASKVKSELTFYEDEDCNVKYGQNPNIDERHLLIRPDITFFNEKQEPILLVEFVVTHKIDNEKRIKLKRLGLNTVQIIIPKKPEDEIEKALKSSTKVKWVYNEVEANTKYIYVSKSSSNGVWEIDDEQRRIFEESYKCRANQISNLIRSVKRIMESQPYKRAEHHFESEISRIESATKAEQQRLDEMEASIDQEVREELAGSFQAIESEEEKFSTEEKSFQREFKNLETRYLNKRSSLEQEQSELSRGYEQQVVFGDTEDGIRAESRIRKIDIKGESESIRNAIDRIRREIEGLPEAFKQLEIDATERFTANRGKEDSEQKDIELKIENFGDYTKEEERKLELEFEELGEKATARINQRDSKGDSELSKRIESVLKAGRISSNYDERLKTYERYKVYLELARGGTWKK